MTSKELIKKVAEELGSTQKEVTAVVDALEVAMKEMLVVDGAKLKVCDLSMSTGIKEAGTARNPKTGEAIEVPERLKMKTSLSADWKRLFKGE